jgi:multiple sugar transport system ATP-binding protein
MNFIEVGLSDANGRLYAEADDFRIRVPGARDAALRPHAGGKVTLGIRPEHVVLGEPAPEHETGFDGGIDVTEQLGSEMVVAIKAAGTALMVSRVDPQIGLKLHESVRLSFNPDHLHFFDRNDEEAIV